MNDILKYIGKKITSLRKSRGMTQEELGDKAGLHWTYIGGVERGEKNLTIKSLEKIARALNVSLKDLLSPVKLTSPKTEKEKLLSEITRILQRQKEKDLHLILKVIKDVLNWRKK